MTAYILLIAFILFLGVGSKLTIADKEKQERFILIVGMGAIFLLLILKKYTVGSDIYGYMTEYEIAKDYLWRDFDYVYFENGYIVLMMIFVTLGLSFQWFTVFIYAIVCSAFYFFIKKYSTNATLSLIIFVCYQFFVFSISGLRQILAMAICIYAFIICDSKKKVSLIFSILLIILATYIHSSASVFFAILVLVYLRPRINFFVWPVVFVLVYAFRKQIWDIVALIYTDRDVSETSMALGGSFLFLVLITVFLGYTYFSRAKKVKRSENPSFDSLRIDSFVVRTQILSLLSYIVFSGGTMLRAAMYFTMFLVPFLPTVISKYDAKTRAIANCLFFAFFIWLFYTETLVPNQLDLCPYKFFWQ